MSDMSGTAAQAGSKRRWLILSHAFNVDGRAESLTITDKIPHLMAAGIEPIVLSSMMGQHDGRLVHEQLLPWGPAGIRFDLRHLLARRWGRGPAYRIVMLVLSLLLAPFIALERLALGLRSQWSWALPATFRGMRIVRRNDIEVIYSTGGVFSAHLAGYWLKRLTGRRWIAEVHDPLIMPGTQPRSRQERFQATLEAMICRNADLAWWFTDGALRAARTRHPELGARGRVILPGAEPPMVQALHAPGPHCVFGHFGSLSPTRSLAPVLEALAGVLQERPQWRDVIRLEVYGGSLDPLAEQLLGTLGLQGVVLPMGRLERDPATGLSGRARVVKRMQEVDVLLMVHGHGTDCAEYIPSKVYDYFWARRPVLALTHQNPQLDALIDAHGGWHAPIVEPVAVQAAIVQAVERWQRHDLADVAVPPVPVSQAVHSILEAVSHA